MDMPHDELTKAFPALTNAAHRVTSPSTFDYNCFAWAAEDSDRRWDPDPWGQFYWPDEAPRDVSVGAVKTAYRTLGYEECTSGLLENGFQKIAIYASADGNATHAARQLPSGLWTSKLGDCEDIEHELGALVGPAYGRAFAFMKKPR